MADQQSTALPEYLAALLHPTPSGVATLLAAWDGLSVESQIRVLTALPTTRGPAHLLAKVYIKALDSGNAYVRYLAAQRLDFHSNDSEEQRRLKQRITHRIARDSDPLVRYSLLERDTRAGIHIGIVDFFALPHEARLACIRRLNLDLNGNDSYWKQNSTYMATLIAYAVDPQLFDPPPRATPVSEMELVEILSNYEGGLDARDMEYLWRFLPTLSETVFRSIIEHLHGPDPAIPDDVLNTMTNQQLIILFQSANIGLSDFRKRIFFELAQHKLSWDDERSGVWRAVVHHNFDLTYPEFLQILEKPEEEKVRMLCHLAIEAKGLSLCLYEAIQHVLMWGTALTEVDGSYLPSPRGYAEYASDEIKRRLATLQGWERKRQICELRLYRLAFWAVPWGQVVEGVPPADRLSFLAEEIVPGDTWRTFMAFSVRWDRVRGHYMPLLAQWQTSEVKKFEAIEKHLPPFPDHRDFKEYRNYIRQDDADYYDCLRDYYAMQSEEDDLGDEDDLAENTVSANPIEERLTEILGTLTTSVSSIEEQCMDLLPEMQFPHADDIEQRLTRLLSTLTTKIDDSETRLADAVGKIRAEMPIAQEKIIQTVNALKDENHKVINDIAMAYADKQEEFFQRLSEESSALRSWIKLLFSIVIIGFVALLFMYK